MECPLNAAIELNFDLNNIYSWAKTWLVDFNAAKTVSLIISKKRSKPHHPVLTLGGTNINEVSYHKHLGIVLSSDATWTNHLEIVLAKAWKRLGYIRQYKFLLNRTSLQKLYQAFIRPLLVYGNILWDNCTIENQRSVENVQLEAARLVTGATKLYSIQRLYDETKWETLQRRRNKHKLFELFKMINGQVPPYLQQLIPLRVQQIARYPLRNSQNYSVPPSRTVTYSSLFLPSTLRDWNALDQNIKDAPSLQTFKNRINGPKRFPPKHFEQQQVSRAVQVLHTRLRLECSSLNHHLYLKSLVDSLLCSCGQIETTTHFFLHCPNYLQPRQHYFSALPYQLTLSLLLNG